MIRHSLHSRPIPSREKTGWRTLVPSLVQAMVFLLFSLLVSAPMHAATYYVDSTSGNDANPGTSETLPWKSIERVNRCRFLPADSILLKRGGVWFEELTVASSGTADNPILFSSYGSGPNKPVIDGGFTRTYCINVNDRDNLHFRDLHLTRSARDGLRGWGADHITVEDVTVEQAKRNNVYFGNSHNLKVRRCQSRYAGSGHGIYIDAGSRDALVEHCVFAGNKKAGVKFNCGDGSVRVPRPVIRYNLLHDNDWCGIDDYASLDALFCHNVFWNNGGYGIRMMWDGTEDPQHLRSSQNARIYNNTILTRHYAGGIRAYADTTGHAIRNNIIDGRDSRSGALLEIDSRASATVDYNGYHAGGIVGPLFLWHGAPYSRLADWQAVSKQDAHSLLADPRFNDPAGRDYSLGAGSPCIDAGIPVGLTQDFLLSPVPSGERPDMGAFERRDSAVLGAPRNLRLVSLP